MNKAEKIKAEIERLKNELSDNKERLNLGEIIAVNNCYNNLIFFIDSLEEETVSNDLEETSKQYALNNSPWDDCVPEVQDAYKAGAQWQKKHLFDNCIKDYDLEEAARKIATRHSHISGDTYYANDAWFFKKGAQWQKERILNNAIEREVKVDAGGYPYIDVTELYDYDKDRPLAKEGDKVKLIIITEK